MSPLRKIVVKFWSIYCKTLCKIWPTIGWILQYFIDLLIDCIILAEMRVYLVETPTPEKIILKEQINLTLSLVASNISCISFPCVLDLRPSFDDEFWSTCLSAVSSPEQFTTKYSLMKGLKFVDSGLFSWHQGPRQGHDNGFKVCIESCKRMGGGGKSQMNMKHPYVIIMTHVTGLQQFII